VAAPERSNELITFTKISYVCKQCVTIYLLPVHEIKEFEWGFVKGTVLKTYQIHFCAKARYKQLRENDKAKYPTRKTRTDTAL